jgi:hypothetical protein
MRFPKIKSTRPAQEQKDLYDFELAQRILSGQNGVIGQVSSLSGARKAIRTAEKTMRPLPHEHGVFINDKGQVLHATNKKEDSINVEEILGRNQLTNSFGTHNHPSSVTEGTFGMEDHILTHRNMMKGLRSVDYDSTMSMHRTNKTPIVPNEIENRYKKAYRTVSNEHIRKQMTDPNYYDEEFGWKIHKELSDNLNEKTWKKPYHEK